MKKTLSFIISILLILGLCSCSGDKSEENSALDTIKTYVTALEEYDVETQKECIDPSINSFSKGFIDSVGSLMKISGAYDMAQGAMGIVGSVAEQALNIEITYEFVNVISSNLSEKSGDITVRYTLVVTEKSTKEKAEQDVSWCFHMIHKGDNWYIQSYDNPVILSQEQIDAHENGEEIIPDNTVGGKATYYTGATHFSDGYAIVNIIEKTDSNYHKKTRAACIDTQGIIRFFFPEGFSSSLNDRMSFLNGVCVLYDGAGTQKIMTNTGKELYTFKSTSLTKISDTGCVVIPVVTSTYQGTTTEYGLMDNQGEWIFEPDEKYSFNYLWDGLFDVTEYLEDGKTKSYYYDTKNGKIIEKSNDKSLSYGYREGLYYEDKKFLDREGNVAIDLSDYANISRTVGFINGRACIWANGFTVIIDKEGNLVCDPIEGRPSSCCEYNMTYSDCISVENGGVDYYYDMNGKFLFECDGLNTDLYSDGLLLESDGTYIDKTGAEIIKSEIRY